MLRGNDPFEPKINKSGKDKACVTRRMSTFLDRARLRGFKLKKSFSSLVNVVRQVATASGVTCVGYEEFSTVKDG